MTTSNEDMSINYRFHNSDNVRILDGTIQEKLDNANKLWKIDVSSITGNVKFTIAVGTGPWEYARIPDWGNANGYTGTVQINVTSIYLE